MCSPGKDHRFGKGRDAERLQHARAVHFDCAHGSAQIDRYLFIRSTREELLEDYTNRRATMLQFSLVERQSSDAQSVGLVPAHSVRHARNRAPETACRLAGVASQLAGTPMAARLIEA